MLVVTGMFIYLIIFASYIELNPLITNIWYRIESDGYRHFRLSNLFNFIIKPFYVKELWFFQYWDLNYWIGSLFTILILHSVDMIMLRINVFKNIFYKNI